MNLEKMSEELGEEELKRLEFWLLGGICGSIGVREALQALDMATSH